MKRGKRGKIAATTAPLGMNWGTVWAAMAVAVAAETSAQKVPQSAVAQLREAIGNRPEAVAILDGQNVSASGFFTFDVNDATLEITKIGGRGEFSPRPLGIGGINWNPLIEGTIGIFTAKNEFESGLLAGNKSYDDIFALSVGAGARFHLTDRFSVAPVVGLLYAHVKNEFKSRTPFGEFIEHATSERLVNWNADTLSITPGLEVSYVLPIKKTTVEFTSTYFYLHTEELSSSSDLLALRGDSHAWQNKIEVDVGLPWSLLAYPLRVGSYFSRTELFGNVREGLNSQHYYTVNGRLVLDTWGKFWRVRWIGVGGSYSWSDSFSGWSYTIDLRVQF